MSLRYRLIHVNAARTQEIRRLNFNFPTADTNVLNIGSGSTRYQSAQALGEAMIANSSGHLSACPTNVLAMRSVNSAYDQLTLKGFSYLIYPGSFSVGDRLYIDRWDANHSYLEVKSVSSTNDDGSVVFDYICYDGTIYLSNITWGCSLFLGQPNSSALPLCANFDNWQVVNDAKIVSYSFTDYSGNRPGLTGNITSTGSGFTLETAKKFWDHAQPIDGDNPYNGADPSAPGGGNPDNQNWDDESDTVTDDALPSIGAVSSGMVSLFSPTDIQIQNLADLLFSYNFFDWLQKNLQNLEELIVSFAMVPFAVSTGGSPSVTFLGFDISSFTHPVNLRRCTEQYYEFPMGSIAFDGSDGRIHTTDSVFDYSPFSTLGIYLPFIGFQELDIDEVRGTILSLKYKIDVLSGTCIAIITVTDSQGSRDIYQFSGNCLTQLPLGSTDLSGIVQGSIAIATAAASAGSSAAVASAGEALSAEKQAAGKLSDAGANLQDKQRGAMVSNSAGNLAGATANGMMGMKPNYKHSGSIGASGSMLAVKQPYIFLKTPREAVPEYYERYCGLPSNITTKLSACSGYTVVEDIRLNGLVATSPEVEEIYQLLKSGVII